MSPRGQVSAPSSSSAASTDSVDGHAPALPKSFLRPCVLLLLREQPAHGYDLLERLPPLGFGRSDPGGLYRVLRGLEDEGLVSSGWERSATGPPRRMYALTRPGMEELHRLAGGLAATHGILAGFLGRYEEFVALRRPAAPAAPGARPAS